MGNRFSLPVSIPQTIQSACHVTLQARTKPEVGDWDMSFSLFWHWWKNAFTCGSCKGNRSVYLWWRTDSEWGRQALLSTIPQEIRLRAFFSPVDREVSWRPPSDDSALDDDARTFHTQFSYPSGPDWRMTSPGCLPPFFLFFPPSFPASLSFSLFPLHPFILPFLPLFLPRFQCS